MDCEHCTRKAAPEMVSRYAMEELAARQGIASRRSYILNIILVLLLFASWVGFFVYESQFEDVVKTETQEVEQHADGSGNNSFVGGDYYGDTESQNNQNHEIPQA